MNKLVSSEPIEQMLSLRLALSPSLVKWKPKKPCILFGCWDGLVSVRQKSPGKSFEVDEYEGKIEPVFTAQTIFLTSEVFACPKLEFQRSGSRIFTSTSDKHHNGGRHIRPLVVLLLCR